MEIMRSRGIGGVPVLEGKRAVGIVTSRDLRFENRLDQPVTVAMTPKEKLVTVPENAPRESVLNLLHKHRIEKLLVVGPNNELRGLITVKDIQKASTGRAPAKTKAADCASALRWAPRPIRSIELRR